MPDDQLDAEGLKQKRHQRLMKSGVEARARARQEKEAEKARLAKEQRLDDEKRENDLPGWLEEKRAERQVSLFTSSCDLSTEQAASDHVPSYCLSSRSHLTFCRLVCSRQDKEQRAPARRPWKPQVPAQSTTHEDPRQSGLRCSGP